MNQNEEIEFLEQMAAKLLVAETEIASVLIAFEQKENSLRCDYDHTALDSLADQVSGERIEMEEVVADLEDGDAGVYRRRRE